MAISLTIPDGPFQLTGNPVLVKASGGAAPSGSEEYMLLLRVASTDAKLFGAPFIDAIAPDSAGAATFDICGYVDQPLTAVFQMPLSGVVKDYPAQTFKITVEAGERYIDSNGDIQTTWAGSPTAMTLLKGGLSPRQVNALHDAASDFYTKYILGGKWLTARPWGDFVHPTQPVKLWYQPAADNSITFRVKGYYDDGTDATADTAISLDADKLYEFNCNPAQNGLTLEPTGKRMTHFDVSLVAESETRRFHFDWNYCEYPVFLMFANTFGGVDDVFFKGSLKEGFVTQGEIASRNPAETDTVFTPTLLNLNKTGQNKWSVNTGFKSISTLQFYRDLLISKQAWYLYKPSTTFMVIPVIIDSADMTLFNRADDIYSMEIGFSEAHRSSFSFDNRIF